MTIRKIANRLQLSVLLVVSFAALTALAHSARADEPTASGLWEKAEAGKPVVWVLVFERGGTYQGAIAKRFLKPRDGKIYSANMVVNSDGRTLMLRGYVGISILGHDEVWNRLPDSVVDILDASILARYLPAAIPATSTASRGKCKYDDRVC